MTPTQVLQEIRKMRFEEAYEGWSEGRLTQAAAAQITEVYRVLRRGGRLAFSDIVALRPLPMEIADDLALYAGCVAGVVTADEMSAVLHDAGFDSVRIVLREKSHQLVSSWAPGRGLERFVAAADVTAIKS